MTSYVGVGLPSAITLSFIKALAAPCTFYCVPPWCYNMPRQLALLMQSHKQSLAVVTMLGYITQLQALLAICSVDSTRQCFNN